MIEFNKIVGKPSKVSAGDEQIWYTDTGLTYVADNNGNPRRFSAGFQEGSTVPVGVPPASGILYYCTGNGKYYLSNPTTWIVLNTEPKTGAGATGGAGGVFITDLGNYYTSVDVEGALQEVGAAFPHLMGARRLQSLTTDLFAFDIAGERRVGANVLNSPTTLTSWLNQRQGSDGKTYGFLISEGGDAWTRHGDNFTELASKADLQEAIEQMGGDLGGAIGEIEGIKVRAGLGVSLSGSGLLSNSPVIGLKTNEIAQMLDGYSAFPFVRNTGGAMTGNLTIAKQTPALDLVADVVGSSSKRTTRVFTATNSDNNAGMRDVTGNINFLNYNMLTKTLELRSGSMSDGVSVSGRLEVTKPNGQQGSALQINGLSTIPIATLVNNNGQFNLASNNSYNYIESANHDRSKPKDLLFTAPRSEKIMNFRVNAHDARFSDRVIAGNGLFLGMDDDHYGKLDFNNKLYIFPYEYRKDQNASYARRHYTHIGYSQKEQTVYVRSFFKDTSISQDRYRELDVNVSASKFLTRSSEKFKEDIELFTENATKIVENADAWIYKLKNDSLGRTNLGFILERGVPDFAIEDNGNAIDSYAMLAILWKAFQELNKRVLQLENN